jgi:hypothetical protein
MPKDMSQSIIVLPEHIPRLLEEIRKAQEPEAKALFHRQRRDALTIRAQILSSK